MIKTRTEKDSLGNVEVPYDVYYGAETERAIINFPISGQKPHPEYIHSIVCIKKAAALVHQNLDLLSKKTADVICKVCDEILAGKFSDQFIVDPYQSGAGTSLHMNVNEVIANRANEILGAPLGSYTYINPHDDVNKSQSTNDVIPTAIRITALVMLPKLLKNLDNLINSFSKKAEEFMSIVKSGRTHLQDALPITLGQEFSAYAKALEHDRNRIIQASQNLYHLGIGGTGVGTGVNSHPRYHILMIQSLSKLTGLSLKSSDNFFESMQNTADFLQLSTSIRTLAYTSVRIGNDLRLLSSGPRTGFGEIRLPAVQAGSSIMPGKINPSILEMVTTVCYQIMGYDYAIAQATGAGQLELNVMLPLIADNLCKQLQLFTNALSVVGPKCIDGIEANPTICRYWFERSVGLGAILNTTIGYEKAAEVVNYAKKNDLTIPEAVVAKKYLSAEKVRKLFNWKSLTSPNVK